MDFSIYFQDERLLSNLLGVGLVLTILLGLAFVVRLILKHGGEGLGSWIGIESIDKLCKEASSGARSILLWSTLFLVVLAVGGMGIYHSLGHDIRLHSQDWIKNLTVDHAINAGILAGKIAILLVGIFITFRIVRRIRTYLEQHVLNHITKIAPPKSDSETGDLVPDPRIKNHQDSIRRGFMMLERFTLIACFLGGVWLSGRLIGFVALDDWCIKLFSLLAIVTIARLVAMSCGTISLALKGIGNRLFQIGPFRRYWDHIAHLFPLGERCLEAAIYIHAATMCVKILHEITFIDKHGKHVVDCIGIFFGTRVVIELCTVFINEAFGMFEEDQLEEQKGRQTLVPLLLSFCQYAIYFGSVFMMLQVFEAPTAPLLASASVLGLALGLGAQSLVTDLVSGFFILFENQFLVGDIVQIGDAQGRVEAISIRLTKIRDEQGKLYIVPNGQIKTVINSSKGYVNAVVDIKVPTSMSLDHVIGIMAEAGRRLRQRHREVLSDTVIKGLVDLTPTDMVVRAVTKVQPGTHQAMQLEYRRLLRTLFEEQKAAPLAA